MTLLPNQSVELLVDTLSGLESYRTRVEDINDSSILLAAPIKLGQVVPIRSETKLQIFYKDDSVTNQGRFRALAFVEKRTNGRIPCLLVKLISPWERTQERDFVRVDVLLDASYASMVDGKAQQTKPCSIRNISGGGLLLFCKDTLEEGAALWIAIPLDNNGIAQAQGRVIRRNPMDGAFGYGVSFVEIDEKDRQAIIQFVFRRQLEMKRKGI